MAIETTADVAATTYATVDQVRDAAEIRGGAVKAAIDDLSDDEILGDLTARTIDFDTLNWIGDRASVDQALEWPRTEAEEPNGTEYSDDAWPLKLVTAVIEQVFADAIAGKIGESATVDPINPTLTAQNLKRQKIGPLEKEYFAPTATTVDLTSVARFAPIVQNLLAPLLRDTASAASEWGTSIARRAS